MMGLITLFSDRLSLYGFYRHIHPATFPSLSGFRAHESALQPQSEKTGRVEVAGERYGAAAPSIPWVISGATILIASIEMTKNITETSRHCIK